MRYKFNCTIADLYNRVIGCPISERYLQYGARLDGKVALRVKKMIILTGLVDHYQAATECVFFME